jgi:glycine/D-amino acid oxidase-like deaminating enzyme
MKEKSCVMIGAGRVGMAAGYLLKDKGWKITILVVHSDAPGAELSSPRSFAISRFLAHTISREGAGRGHSPALRLFHTTAAWESLLLCGNGVKSFAHRQPFFQGGEVLHEIHHEGVIRGANDYMLRLGRPWGGVKARTSPWM